VAGADASTVFTKEAVRAIYGASQGIPRTIGVICENTLLASFAAQKKPVDGEIVTGVCRDLDLPLDGQPVPRHGDVAKGLTEPLAAAPPHFEPQDREPPRRRVAWLIGRRRKPAQDTASEGESQPSRLNHRIFRF